MRTLAAFASALVVGVALSADLAAQTRMRPGGDGGGGGDTGRVAVPRNDPPPQAAPPPPPRAPEPRTAAAPPARVAADGGDGQRRAQPRGTRPQGDNPTVGVAVPRSANNPPRRPGDFDRVSYYYYPRLYYPYGYGAFGLGYYYYDPYSWYPGSYWDYARFSGYGYGYPTGEIRLKVKPRDAEVYVDGYYAGTVNDFDGFAQALRLEEGPYTIEIRAPGYTPLSLNVRIQPGRKITYEEELRPE